MHIWKSQMQLWLLAVYTFEMSIISSKNEQVLILHWKCFPLEIVFTGISCPYSHPYNIYGAERVSLLSPTIRFISCPLLSGVKLCLHKENFLWKAHYFTDASIVFHNRFGVRMYTCTDKLVLYFYFTGGRGYCLFFCHLP